MLNTMDMTDAERGRYYNEYITWIVSKGYPRGTMSYPDQLKAAVDSGWNIKMMRKVMPEAGGRCLVLTIHARLHDKLFRTYQVIPRKFLQQLRNKQGRKGVRHLMRGLLAKCFRDMADRLFYEYMKTNENDLSA